MRRAGILGALLATAVLLCAMPGLLRQPLHYGRADEKLRPPKLRTLTVWLMPGDVGDRKLLSQLCAAFEKERPGVRVFLRIVTADELEGETAVLPDAVLYETGDLNIPEKVFLPIAHAAHPSGQFAGTAYAVPLWLSPNVLTLPQNWLQRGSVSTPKTSSLLASSTAGPQQETNALLAADELPWGMLMQKNAIEKPQGVGWQQLLSCCPEERRAQLVHAVTDASLQSPLPSPEPEDWVTTLPFSRSASPTPIPAITMPARVEPLAQHLARVQRGEPVCAFVFPTAVSDRVRYVSLCRDGEDAQAFVQFLLAHQGDALAHALIPPAFEGASADPTLQALITAFGAGALPNAFAHTKQEILQLCADSFARCEDPVRTLLGLR